MKERRNVRTNFPLWTEQGLQIEVLKILTPSNYTDRFFFSPGMKTDNFFENKVHYFVGDIEKRGRERKQETFMVKSADIREEEVY